MRVRIAGFVLLVAFYSCFLFRDYKREEFTYTQQGARTTVPLVVPRGFVKEESVDTAGVFLKTFYYGNGAMLYAAYVTDTATMLQPINNRVHQPQYHRLGGLVYKGQDQNELFYREIQQGHLRFGYRKVPRDWELLFDSATNHASLQKNHLR
ncbi:MAG TPA: hypothetical protein VGN63_12025 [Flavisolibacter sp.]|jgi:hypothetical protein|nr:hypothetical protein [Flavisolibacter sp.]